LLIISPEPVPKNMQATFNAVKKYNADVAFVTDGDADRLAAADNRAEYIITPKIAALLKNRSVLNTSFLILFQAKRLSVLKKAVGSEFKTIFLNVTEFSARLCFLKL